MAKVEQHPDQAGDNIRTEDILKNTVEDIAVEDIAVEDTAVEDIAVEDTVMKDVATEEERRALAGDTVVRKKPLVPDDSLLMGTDSKAIETPPAEAPEETRPAARKVTRVDDSLLMGMDDGQDDEPEEAAAQDDEPEETPKAKWKGFFGRAKAEGKAEAPGAGETPRPVGMDGSDYEERIRRHRERIRYIRILCAAAVVVAIALVALFFSTRHYNRAEIIKIRDFVAEESSGCVGFDGYILQYGPNGATCADKKGRVKWSITYEMDQPIISISGNVAAIADYGGRVIYVLDTKKQLCTINTSLPIHKVAASECGEVAAVLDDKSASWIRLYSAKGKEIAYFIRSMEENGYPMDVAVSPDGTTVCVSSMKLKDAAVISTLGFYNFGKAGQKYDQHLVQSFEYKNEVFPYVRFMGNNACCAASDSRFVVFDTTGTEPKNSINNMLIENLQGIFGNGDKIALVFTDLTRENLYRIDLYGRSGKKEGSLGFTMAYKDLQICGNRIYITNEQSMQIYTLDGKEIFNGGFDRAVKVIIPSRWFGGITAVTENEIDEVELR